jgi:acetyl esterase/lipase
MPRMPLNLERGTINALGRAPRPVQRLIGVRSAPSQGASMHPEAALIIRLLNIAPSSGFERMPLAEGRARLDHDAAVLGGPPIPMARVQGVRIPTPSGGIGGRLYVADERDTDRLLVYYHGGGFVVGSLNSVETVCRFIAKHAGIAVLSVDYRLAPEHPFPAAHDDAIAAFRFAVARAAQWGHDPDLIAVGGDSAGATLATVLCHDLRGSDEVQPAFQLLFYPATDQVGHYPSHAEFAEGFFLTYAQMIWFRGLALAGHDPTDPRVSPLLAKDLTDLPPAYIAVAGFDVLRDEGEAYARKLAEAGVQVALRRHERLIHAFVNATGLSVACREAFLEACGALRVAVGGGLAPRARTMVAHGG